MWRDPAAGGADAHPATVLSVAKPWEEPGAARLRPVRVVAVLGVPGSGKSTQARLVAAELGGVARSVGDWVRARAAAGDRAAAETVHTGQAIPPALYRAFLDDGAWPALLVLDGSPRDEHHVAVLADAVATRGPQVTGVLLDLPADRAAARVAGRRSTRPDDAGPVAAARVAGQAAALAGLVTAFRARWPLTVVDATAPPAAVTARILRSAAAPGPGCPPGAGRSS